MQHAYILSKPAYHTTYYYYLPSTSASQPHQPAYRTILPTTYLVSIPSHYIPSHYISPHQLGPHPRRRDTCTLTHEVRLRPAFRKSSYAALTQYVNALPKLRYE